MSNKKEKAEKPELSERDKRRRERNLELLRYLIVGTTTTAINWGVAILLREVFGVTGGLNSVISWIVSIIFFAFWAYKLFVFRSKTLEKGTLLWEFVGFVSGRLFTLLFEWAFMYVFVTALGFDQVIRIGFTRLVDGADAGSFGFNVREFYIFKLIATVFVTILNYIISKLIVFSGKNPLLAKIGRKLAAGGEDEDTHGGE